MQGCESGFGNLNEADEEMLSGEKKGFQLIWTDSNGPFDRKRMDRLDFASCSGKISGTKRFESVNRSKRYINQVLHPIVNQGNELFAISSEASVDAAGPDFLFAPRNDQLAME